MGQRPRPLRCALLRCSFVISVFLLLQEYCRPQKKHDVFDNCGSRPVYWNLWVLCLWSSPTSSVENSVVPDGQFRKANAYFGVARAFEQVSVSENSASAGSGQTISRVQILMQMPSSVRLNRCWCVSTMGLGQQHQRSLWDTLDNDISRPEYDFISLASPAR